MSEKKKSVYAGIADDILDKIKNNIYPIGSLLPPEREFMTIYSVQRTTVRRGLDLLSLDGYIKKVAGLGSVVVSDKPSQTVGDTKTSVAVYRKEEANGNYSILMPEAKSALPSLLPDLLSNLGKVGAGFMTSSPSDIDKQSTVIAVDANYDIDNPVCLALCQNDDRRSVILDNDKGAYIALSYLEGLGHTKIAYIGTSSGFSFENAAHDSFCAVNSFLDEELIMLSGADEKSGFDGFSELFRRHGGKFTAVCTVNDAAAKGVIKAAKYYKLRVPEDLSVISLCSTRKDSGIDGIYYDMAELAEEILYSADNCRRISTVLFGGSLAVKGTSTSIKADADTEKKMSDFLL